MNEEKVEEPFLYYTSGGVCKSNQDMPTSATGFYGWYCASSVIRNQGRHSAEDVRASLDGLRRFLESLGKNRVIKERDLLRYVRNRVR